MIRYFLRDCLKNRFLIGIIALVLIVVISVSNLILMFFYSHINLDRDKNHYYNIYLIKLDRAGQDDVKKIQQEIKKILTVPQEGYSLTGNLSISGANLRAAAFSEGDVSKFYTLKSTESLKKGSLILKKDGEVNLSEWSQTIVSNLITIGDMRISVDCVIGQQDFEEKIKEVEYLGIEFSRHLTWFELLKLQQLGSKNLLIKEILYQKTFSPSALEGIKNLLISSILMIVYIISATLGLLRYFFSRQVRVIKVYFICGASKKDMFFWYGIQTVLLFICAMAIAMPLSFFVYKKAEYSIEGGLWWIPFFINGFILFCGMGAILCYEVKRIWREVIS